MLQINSFSLQSGSWTQFGLIIPFSKFFNPNIKYQNLKNEKKKRVHVRGLSDPTCLDIEKKKQPSPCTRNFIFFIFKKVDNLSFVFFNRIADNILSLITNDASCALYRFW